MNSVTFHQYLFARILRSFAVIFLTLQAIALSRSMIYIFENTLEKEYPYSAIAWVLTYSALNTLTVVLTFSGMLAVVLTLGQYHHHRELHAAAFLGIGYQQFVRTILSFCLPLALVMSFYTLGISPLLSKHNAEVLRSFKETLDVGIIGAGQFTKINENLYVFAEKYTPVENELENIFIAKLDEKLIVTAQRGKQIDYTSGNKVIDLYQGYSYQGEPGETQFGKIGFDKYTLNLQTNEPLALNIGPELRTSWELIQSATLGDWSELQRRISMPIILLIASLFALMVYLTPNYQGRKNIRYLLLIKGIVFFLVYGNTTILLTKLGANNALFLHLGWVMHLVLLLVCMAIMTGKISVALNVKSLMNRLKAR
ncbi:MAG: LptF/LptG family permease [Candidatus Oxydemutatoraceae bacterium WSBS_2016_MAG_OTU14]